MRFLITLPLLVVLVAAYPYSAEEDEKTLVTLDYYPESLVIYKGEHEIVDIMVPLNSASEHDSSESDISEASSLKKHLMVFFVEADMKDGHREDRGIHVYKDGKTTKVMDEGRAVAASADESKDVFMGAKDGLYVYNHETGKADKYGDFDASIKDMAKEHNTDALYILTDDHELYKVYDEGTKKWKIDDVKDAEQIMIDYSNNLYYYGKDKKPYVRTAGGETKEIEGLPEGAKEVKLYRPPLYNDEGAEFLVDTEMYTIYPDGRSEAGNFEFMPEAKPTAYSMEAAVFRYFGYQKKIYEYDFLSMIDSSESRSDSESGSKSDSKSHSKSDSKSHSGRRNRRTLVKKFTPIHSSSSSSESPED